MQFHADDQFPTPLAILPTIGSYLFRDHANIRDILTFHLHPELQSISIHMTYHSFRNLLMQIFQEEDVTGLASI